MSLAGIEQDEAAWRAAKAKLVGEDTLALAEAQVDESGESVVLRLAVPVTVGDQEVHRITFGPLRVKHLRAAAGLDDFSIAATLADEVGKQALPELASQIDQLAVDVAASRQMGKFRRAGRVSSST